MKTGIKILALVFGLMMMFSLSHAQDVKNEGQQEPPKTKLEQFLAREGMVLIKSYNDLGYVAGQLESSVNVTALELIDAATDRRQYGAVLEVQQHGRLKKESRSYVDADEIESLIRGIDYIKRIDVNKTKFPMFEAAYSTKGNLRVIAFNDRYGAMSASIESGRIYRANCFTDLAGLDILRELLVKAKASFPAVPVTPMKGKGRP